MKHAFCLILFAVLLPSVLFAQWHQGTGVYGGYSMSGAVIDSEFFLGSQSGGLFKSTDDGQSWTLTFNGASGLSIRAIVVETPYVYLGTGYGLYRSTDNGATWNQQNSGLTPFISGTPSISSMAQLGTGLYAGVKNRLLKSTDHGMTWAAADSGLPRNYVYGIVQSSNSLFAGMNYPDGVYRSTNDGVSWSRSDSANISGSVLSLAAYSQTKIVGGVPVVVRYVFASASSGVYVTTNDGSSWSPARSGLPSDYYRFSLVTNGSSPTLYAGSNNGLYYSIDNGASWWLVNGTAGDAFYAVCSLNGTLVGASTPHGAMRSTDGGASFQPSNIGMRNASVQGVTLIDSTFYAALNNDDVYTSTDFGQTWSSLHVPDAMKSWSTKLLGVKARFYVPRVMTVKKLFAAPMSKGVWRSDDLGQTWVRSDTGIVAPYVYNLAYATNALGYTVYAATPSGVAYSSDGRNWSMSKPSLPDSNVSDVAASGSYVFAGTTNGTVYRSTDGAMTWAPVAGGRAASYVRAMAVQDTTVYVADGYGVFAVGVNGDTWTSFFSGLTAHVTSFIPVQGGIVALTLYGAKYLPVGASTWQPIMASDYTYMNSGAAYGDLLVVGTDHSSILWGHFGQIVTAAPQTPAAVPETWQLSQNYPNPFNPATVIEYTVGASRSQDLGFSQVRLSVYDLLGREVAVLVNERQSTGVHQVRFNAENLPTGAYFYRLQSGGFTQTKRMMLVK